MRELDQLLTGWLERHYDHAPDDEKQAFRELLALSDPELVGYLLKRQLPGCEVTARVVESLRRPA